MTKLFLLLIPLTILSAISTGIVALTFDPFKSDGFVKLLFFTSMASFLWGSGAIAFSLLNLFYNDRPGDALRRGFFVAILGLSLVLLNRMGYLFWYTGFAAAVIIMVVELIIYKKAKVAIVQPTDYQ